MSNEDRTYRWLPTAEKPAEPDPVGGFLGRWARRKAEVERGEVPDEPAEAQALEAEAEAEDPGERIDPRTGKRYEDLTDEDMPPLESLDASSDLSVFLARNVSPALRMKALTRVFHSAKYNKICLCAEYADDYTSFEPLGDILPHDLKASIAREAGKLRDRLMEIGEEISPEEAEERIAQEMRGERTQQHVPIPADDDVATTTGARQADAEEQQARDGAGS